MNRKKDIPDDSLDIPPPPPMDNVGPADSDMPPPPDMDSSNIFPPTEDVPVQGGAPMNTVPPPMDAPAQPAPLEPSPVDAQPPAQTVPPPEPMTQNDLFSPSEFPDEPKNELPPSDIPVFAEPKPRVKSQHIQPIYKPEPIMPTQSNRFMMSEPEHHTPYVRGDKIFVEVSEYRRVLRDLNAIKKSLKDSNDEVGALQEDIESEGRTFVGLSENLALVEKRLAELEGVLYKH